MRKYKGKESRKKTKKGAEEEDNKNAAVSCEQSLPSPSKDVHSYFGLHRGEIVLFSTALEWQQQVHKILLTFLGAPFDIV